MTKAAELAGHQISLKTALIEFTDGDDAIAIADAGVVTLLTSAVIKSEGGAVTHNITQGLAKCWVFLQSNGTSISDSFNVTTNTDVGRGDYTITIANNMASDKFVCSIVSGSHATSYNLAGDGDTLSTTVFDIRGANAGESATLDLPNTNGVVHGTLA